MKMMIEESLVNLKKLQGDYQQFHDDVWQDSESYGIMAESLKVAVETMCRYQKIEQIVKAWNDWNSFDNMVQISEVVEDGRN